MLGNGLQLWPVHLHGVY